MTNSLTELFRFFNREHFSSSNSSTAIQICKYEDKVSNTVFRLNIPQGANATKFVSDIFLKIEMACSTPRKEICRLFSLKYLRRNAFFIYWIFRPNFLPPIQYKCQIRGPPNNHYVTYNSPDSSAKRRCFGMMFFVPDANGTYCILQVALCIEEHPLETVEVLIRCNFYIILVSAHNIDCQRGIRDVL